MRKRMMRRIIANALVVMVLCGASPIEKTSTVRLSGDRIAVSVSGTGAATLPADHVFVQLLLIGDAVAGTRQYLSDAVLPGPRVPIESAQLEIIVRSLVSSGVPISRIRAHLGIAFPIINSDIVAIDGREVRDDHGTVVGQILVNVDNERIGERSRLINDLKTAMGHEPGLRLGGLIAARNSCAVKRMASSAADTNAQRTADAFGNAIGLRITKRLSYRLESLDDASIAYRNVQSICGGITWPQIPGVQAENDLRSWLSSPPVFHVTIKENAVFEAVGHFELGHLFIPNVIESRSVPTQPGNDGITVTSDAPLIRARGTLKARVRVQRLLIVIVYGDSAADRAAHEALHEASVSQQNVSDIPGRLAFLAPARNESLRAVSKLRTVAGIRAWFLPVSVNCDVTMARLFRNAAHEALKRARTMAVHAGAEVNQLVSVQATDVRDDSVCAQPGDNIAAIIARAVPRYGENSISGIRYLQKTSVDAIFKNTVDDTLVASPLHSRQVGEKISIHTSELTAIPSAARVTLGRARLNASQVLISGDIEGATFSSTHTKSDWMEWDPLGLAFVPVASVYVPSGGDITSAVAEAATPGDVKSVQLIDQNCEQASLLALSDAVTQAIGGLNGRLPRELIDEGAEVSSGSTMCNLTNDVASANNGDLRELPYLLTRPTWLVNRVVVIP